MSFPHIDRVDAYRVKIPLATPYHLSKVYGTLTHSDVVLVRVGVGHVHGWGEADPGGMAFTGDTAASVFADLKGGAANALIGADVSRWVEQGAISSVHGAIAAAFDVAIHDTYAKHADKPLWQLLGDRCRNDVDVLWPTSSGSADDDLAIIRTRAAQGFRTYMLKMGDRPVADEIERVRNVMASISTDVKIMVDANQGWQRDEAMAFVSAVQDLPLVLIEQPVAADDLTGLRQVRKASAIPVSVDESLQKAGDAQAVIAAEAADVFSIKVSKNGGLKASLAIAQLARERGIKVLMNSMIELGITQCASLHLACVLDNLLDCGHAYMSTLRMADDVTDFSQWIAAGRVRPTDRPGLGVQVNADKIQTYLQEALHVDTR